MACFFSNSHGTWWKWLPHEVIFIHQVLWGLEKYCEIFDNAINTEKEIGNYFFQSSIRLSFEVFCKLTG